MCQEVFEIAKTLDLQQLQTQLALQCSPVLTGIKISNLLIVGKGMEVKLFHFFADTEITIFKICERQNRDTYLLYREKELIKYLFDEHVKYCMHRFGYECDELHSMLHVFAEKYQRHMDEGTGFPHEMGLFLGYPVDDVMGFIQHQGKNYRYCGYWKVYGNVSHAKRKFYSYDRAKENMIRLIAGGSEIKKTII